ncbi:MAG TPA: hypothetical protein VJ385_06800, partial [Fibrobacteria bacterium]|nr:hypothetical protein [Fibrobacteria bacterium]
MKIRGYLPTMLFCLPALAASGIHRVLVDAPGRLELEISPSAFTLSRVEATRAMRAACAPGGVPCGSESAPGAPDLPFFAFDMLTGPSEPQVSVQVLESEIRTVPEGLSPVGRVLAPDRQEYRIDPDLFLRAASPTARIAPVRFLRGVPVRTIRIPLALWSEAGRTLTLLTRVRVEAVSAGVQARPSRMRLEGSFLAQVLNPIGGPYL